ncbi:MAG: glycoside hydrolase family 32 protein [Herpetosiphon sp.]
MDHNRHNPAFRGAPTISEELRTRIASDPHRPVYHFMPEANWMNDPNGLIQWNGRYHLFYQYNPNGAFHATMHWGHAVSSDLVHWNHLPVALVPTPGGPDQDGCFSGCAVDNDGVATFVYTGVNGLSQLTCLATSNDDLLLMWTKDPANPVIASTPPGIDLVAYRDHSVWREGASWYQIIGGGIVGIGGTALLYRSFDLHTWEYLGPILIGDKLATDNVWTGEMWECPDLFPLDGRHVLLISVWHEQRLHYCVSMVGSFDGMRFVANHQVILDAGGSLYAPQTFRDAEHRRLLFGWLREQRSDAAQVAAGWSGAMSLPRILFLTSDGRLGQRPAPELGTLRRTHTLRTDIVVDPGSSLPLEAPAGDVMELLLEWQLGAASCVELAVRCSPAGEEQTVVVYDRQLRRLTVDRSRASLDPGTTRDVVGASLELADGEALRLHVFLDRSILEIFANETVTLTPRIYPTRPDSLGLRLAAFGGTATVSRLEMWKLSID